MSDFFGNVVGQTIPWFGLVHILLLFGFFFVFGIDLDFRSKN